jgi:hypothetical protein
MLRNPGGDGFPHYHRSTLKVLYIALLFFVGLALNTKDGRDRLIYGAFAVATLVAIIHYRQHPWLFPFRS